MIHRCTLFVTQVHSICYTGTLYLLHRCTNIVYFFCHSYLDFVTHLSSQYIYRISIQCDANMYHIVADLLHACHKTYCANTDGTQLISHTISHTTKNFKSSYSRKKLKFGDQHMIEIYITKKYRLLPNNYLTI